ncbi:tyrosyl-DNA phosphodiesterase [Xylariaceae sp. FL1272]|nr:tyrosyl-DNA phosphodiesterase [Xylariaceae sp. FL1272]
MAEPSVKRQRLSDSDGSEREWVRTTPSSLLHPISPPRKKRAQEQRPEEQIRYPSPFRLTTIRDLPETQNVGALSLGDLVGDPLIAEIWEFNYLHDIDFLLSHLDQDTRALTKIHVVHGFWKNEDASRLMLQEQASQHDNVTLHTAFMPEIFGTHHSKMMILIRHDDTAQVVIHTANMIAKDWTNMTNGIWQSPLLPKLKTTDLSNNAPVGSGPRFKIDLLNYLRAYNTRRNVCKPLVDELAQYDFSAIRGALIASVPGKHDVEHEPDATRWGWQGLKETLKNVPMADISQPGKSDIVVQISSIATLGAKDTWLQRTLFDSLSPVSSGGSKPNFKVVFPTPDDVRRSLDGYASGGSIHTKIQSSQQAKQLEYLRPFFHHWANDGASNSSSKDAGRQRAAPHIKTYIRHGEKSIDWALLTSANISKQAWGEATKSGEVRVASWEIGVLVWPELLTGDAKARLIGTFQTDEPAKEEQIGENNVPTVGLRIPYSMPLQKYGPTEVPWVATNSHLIPDCKGQIWSGW